MRRVFALAILVGSLVSGTVGHATDALVQPDAATAAQVDGGNQEHAGSRRKLYRIRAPALPERSGWNWVPKKLSRCTMAVRSVP